MLKFEVELTYPRNIRLHYDKPRLEGRVGKRIASIIQSRMMSGQRGDGTPLPKPETAPRSLDRTGDLIRSIRYRAGWIGPSTSPRDDVGDRLGSNAGLLGALISGRGRGRRGLPDYGDVLGSNSAAIDAEMNQRAEAELASQLARGTAGLRADMRTRKLST